MKVVVLNWLDRANPQAGGAEVHLHETFGRLARRGWEVTLVASGWPGAPRRAEADGLRIHRVGGRHTFALLAPAYTRWTFPRAAFDLLVEDLNKVPLFFPTWSRWPGALLVHHLFGRTAFREASPPVALATWLLERPIPRVYREIPTIAISPSTRDDLVERGLARERIQVAENGVDLDSLSPGPEGERFRQPTLGYLGRLKRYKRVDLLIDAVGWLRAEGVPARMIVAGEGSHRRALEGHARALGLGPEIVDFRGYVSESEKRELLRRVWVHGLTSEKEGWGLSILEAAASGTPTVASDSPGLRDTVVDGTTGFLVPHGDLGALARQLGRLLSDPALRTRMGRAARSHAEAYSWDRSAERLGALLEAAPRG
jgi:glycosyltransferase involved in cell wall biosynthesis